MSPSRKVVLIMTDTQRHDMLNCYRNTGLKTPSLDRLATQGCRFEKAYTTQPLCQPARAALFFGRYPHEVGSWANSMGPDCTAYSLGQRLQKESVHTAYVGKWHLDGGDYFGTGVCPPGWDPAYWFDMKNYLDTMTKTDRLRSRRAETNEDGLPSEFTFAHQVSERAIDFLQNHGQEDFFLAVSFDEPHDPYLCPEPYASMYQDYEFPRPANVEDPLNDKPQHQQVWAGEALHADRQGIRIRQPDFFGCNSYVDAKIGQVLDAVWDWAPDALILYTSDHGDFLESHRLSGKGPAAYEEITHVPLLISGPGIPHGHVDAAPVSHVDLAPTIFDWMGLDIPVIFSGNSLVPQWSGASKQVNEQIFMEYGRYEVDHDGFGGFQPFRAAFDGRFKLVINLLSSDELYDLQEDPGEMDNRISDIRFYEVRDRLHDAILRQMNETRDPFRGYAWERRPWRGDAAKPTWAYTGMTRQRQETLEERQLDYATGLPMEKAVRPKD